MGLEVEWDNSECTVLRYTVIGPWTWEEFYQTREKARRLADNTPHPRVDMIIDMRFGNKFPSNALFHFRRLPAEPYPKLIDSNVIIIENNLFVATLIDAMRHINAHAMRNFHCVRTLEQARVQLDLYTSRSLSTV